MFVIHSSLPVRCGSVKMGNEPGHSGDTSLFLPVHGVQTGQRGLCEVCTSTSVCLITVLLHRHQGTCQHLRQHHRAVFKPLVTSSNAY